MNIIMKRLNPKEEKEGTKDFLLKHQWLLKMLKKFYGVCYGFGWQLALAVVLFVLSAFVVLHGVKVIQKCYENPNK